MQGRTLQGRTLKRKGRVTLKMEERTLQMQGRTVMRRFLIYMNRTLDGRDRPVVRIAGGAGMCSVHAANVGRNAQ